jgi:hypothetical protein
VLGIGGVRERWLVAKLSNTPAGGLEHKIRQGFPIALWDGSYPSRPAVDLRVMKVQLLRNICLGQPYEGCQFTQFDSRRQHCDPLVAKIGNKVTIQ